MGGADLTMKAVICVIHANYFKKRIFQIREEVDVKNNVRAFG